MYHLYRLTSLITQLHRLFTKPILGRYRDKAKLLYIPFFSGKNPPYHDSLQQTIFHLQQFIFHLQKERSFAKIERSFNTK